MDNKQFSSLNEVNNLNICLLCLETNDNLLEVFGKKGIELNIAAILHEHFWFEVSASSASEEKNICDNCWKNVESFDNFYNFVKSTHEGKCFHETKSIDVDKQIELVDVIKAEPDSDIKEDLNESTDMPGLTDRFKQEEDSIASTDSWEDEQSNRQSKRKGASSTTTSAQAFTKKFKTDSHSSLLSKYFNMACDLCDAMLSSYRDTNQHYKDVHNLDKGYLICCSKKFFRLQHMLQHCEWHMNPDSFKCSQCPKTFSDKYRLRDHSNLCHTPEIDKVFSCDGCDKTFSKRHYLTAHQRKGHNAESTEEKSARKPRINIDKEHEMIRNRFLMQCDLCAEPYTIFRDAQLHHLKAHNQAGYLYCCDRKFFKMYKAVQHCIWHDDPESFKCSFCQKCFTDKISLRDHIRNVHSPEDERHFQCDICKRSFAKSYLLRSHMKVNHVKDEDKKFECHVCGFRFVNVSFLRSHIKRVHHNVHSHICELCAKPFKSGKSYEKHYINFHTTISQKVQCDICGKWLKHKDSLKKHILWHNSKTETCGVTFIICHSCIFCMGRYSCGTWRQSYQLQVCGRVSSNIRALRAHIRSAHRVASLECTICGKMFKKQQVLKEHMAIHAGITDLYTCTFCTKTFRSNANMYSHRKRAHPVELEQKKAGVPAGP